jgi:uncharacterized Zn finger protein
MKKVLETMPKHHLRLLAFLIKFFKKVEEHSKSNLMTSYNLGVVFAPTILRPKVITSEDLMNVGSSIIAIQLMMENYKDLFENENLKTFSMKKDLFKRKSMIIEEWNKMEEHATRSNCKVISEMMASKDDPEDDIPIAPSFEDRFTKQFMDEYDNKADEEVEKLMGRNQLKKKNLKLYKQ